MIEQQVTRHGMSYWRVDDLYDLPSPELATELEEWLGSENTPFDKAWVARMFYIRHDLKDWTPLGG